jgi:cell division protein FtsQ
MARKQAKRRKPPKARNFNIKLPKINLARFVTPLVAVGLIAATYEISSRMLDRDIGSLEISGPFQRVSALQIEEAVEGQLDAGFLGADLGKIRGIIRDLPWVDQAAVARRWPNRIAINVTEQVPAAIWGESGLLNVRGELFVKEARHIPAELPRLSGPTERSADVARRYLSVRDQLIPIGLDLRRVHLDDRGAWEMTLTNGVEVRFGRRDVDQRTDLFIGVVADLITGRATEIDHVDMRYSNGFTVGWKGTDTDPANEPESTEQEMLALRGDQ